MKDLCFFTGLLLGAGIGMVVATKNKQVKKIVECSEQSFGDAMNEVKMAIQEPVCECVNCDNSQSSSNKTTKSKSKKTQKNKEN